MDVVSGARNVIAGRWVLKASSAEIFASRSLKFYANAAENAHGSWAWFCSACNEKLYLFCRRPKQKFDPMCLTAQPRKIAVFKVVFNEIATLTTQLTILSLHERTCLKWCTF